MMHTYYGDILDRISESPKWWDESAVPRYVDFTPHGVANIYADEVALVLITCQGCGTGYNVAFSQNEMDRFGGRDDSGEYIMHPKLSELIPDRRLHYGDPPNTPCCPAGATMNSEPREVLEFWERGSGNSRFVRVPELEVNIEPKWVTEP